MSSAEDEFEAVRREPDPVARGRMATDLLVVYQQRSIELARLRREAIEQIRGERGLSYSAVAAELGLSKGRVGQITQRGPAVERAFFGVGPVTVAVPLRQTVQRALPVIASEDALAAERLTAALVALQFQVRQLRIPADGLWTPPAETVAICGPKSSPVIAEALASDPVLQFAEDGSGQWVIRERRSGTTYRSPMDERGDLTRDMAYLGRLVVGRSVLLVIAGVHALGSVGAVEYLTRHLAELYREVGRRRFSMVVASRHAGEVVQESEVVCGPLAHE